MKKLREVFGITPEKKDFDKFIKSKKTSPALMMAFQNMIHYNDINKGDTSRFIFFEMVEINYNLDKEKTREEIK